MFKMHKDDAHDQDLIAIEISKQIHTCAQLRAAENAANSHFLAMDILVDSIDSSLDARNDKLALSR